VGGIALSRPHREEPDDRAGPGKAP
jgi:hypothetical protein